MNKLRIKNKILITNIVFALQEMRNDYLPGDDERFSLEVTKECLERTFKITAENKRSFVNVGLLNLLKGIPDEHICLAEQLNILATEAMVNRDYEEAVQKFSKAIDEYPSNGKYFLNRADAYIKIKKNHEAIKDCQQALILDPFDATAYEKMGIAYRNLNQWKETIRAFKYAWGQKILAPVKENLFYSKKTQVVQATSAEIKMKKNKNLSEGPLALYSARISKTNELATQTQHRNRKSIKDSKLNKNTERSKSQEPYWTESCIETYFNKKFNKR